MAYFPNSFAAHPTSLAPQAIHPSMVDSCHFGWGRNRNGSEQQAHPSPPPPHQQAQRPSSWLPSLNPRLRPCSNKFYHLLICGHRVRTVLPEPCADNCLEPWEYATTTGRFYCSDCLDTMYEQEYERLKAQDLEAYQSQSLHMNDQKSLYMTYSQQLDAEFQEHKAREAALTRETIPCPPLELKGDVMDVASDLETLSLSLTQTATNTSRNSTASPPQLPATNRIDLPTDPSQQLHLQLSGLALDRRSCGVEDSLSFQGQAVVRPMSDMDAEEL